MHCPRAGVAQSAGACAVVELLAVDASSETYLDVSCREGVKTRVVVMSHFVKPKCVPTPFFPIPSFPTVFVVGSLSLSRLKFEKSNSVVVHIYLIQNIYSIHMYLP